MEFLWTEDLRINTVHVQDVVRAVWHTANWYVSSDNPKQGSPVIFNLADENDTSGPNYSLGHNTDGFDVSASNGLTIYASKVYNNDDCLAINSGSNINFINNLCSGGHGISIGSIQTGAIVENINVSGCIVNDSYSAVRIKAYPNAVDAKVNNVTYTNIKMSGIQSYGVVIEQDYLNGGPTGKPGGASEISNINLDNIHGTMSGGESVYILCANCNNFNFKKIAITGGKAPNC
ncbi:hypothetical protein BGZ46_006142, partial [Entomortierella lignicola]